MYPTIFEYNGFVISSYGFMLMTAFLVCNHLLKKHLYSINVDGKIADDIIFYAAIGGILGSKIYYIIEEKQLYETYISIGNIFKGIFTLNSEILTLGISQFGGGLVFLGGLMGGMLTVSYYIKKNNLNWLEVSDWVAPYLALGHCIGRLGCFFVGDCYGTITNLPWKVTFKNGLPATTYENFSRYYPDLFNSDTFQSLYPALNSSSNTLIYVHPTQLYESILGFIIYIYLINLRKKRLYNGMVMFEYLFLAGITRFLIEFIRLNPSYFLNFSGAQIISIIMILIASILMKINNQKTYSYGKN